MGALSKDGGAGSTSWYQMYQRTRATHSLCTRARDSLHAWYTGFKDRLSVTLFSVTIFAFSRPVLPPHPHPHFARRLTSGRGERWVFHVLCKVVVLAVANFPPSTLFARHLLKPPGLALRLLPQPCEPRLLQKDERNVLKLSAGYEYGLWIRIRHFYGDGTLLLLL